MSLFPAYENEATKSEETTTSTSQTWLENNSFKQVPAQVDILEISSSSSDCQSAEEHTQKKLKKHKKKRNKDKHKDIPTPPTQPTLAFDGSENYYVDKKSAPSYNSIDTLYKPACPRYHKPYRRCIGWYILLAAKQKRKPQKRYYSEIQKELNREGITAKTVKIALEENEFDRQLTQCNRNIMESPMVLQNWLDVVELQSRNPYKWTRLKLAEKQLDLLTRALSCHARNETLYRLYIDILNDTYLAFEVSKFLDDLLSKDPYNYQLWTAQIMTTQGTMARCTVPNVLKIYERCMQKMNLNSTKRNQKVEEIRTSDEVMLKLFYNCALFMRQSGLMEMFFTLIKLYLELNVSSTVFGDFQPSVEDQRTLIEYEELVLKSGLPLTELWLRIEKLRQCFNFLPCQVQAENSDPQRVVFTEDIFNYIYPIRERDHAFLMLLQILRLMKVPFVQSNCLAEKFNARVEDIGDSDAIEDALAICVRNHFVSSSLIYEQFLSSLVELAKEMATSPTFLNNSIAHEIYTRFICEFILNCAASYENIDEGRRLIFLLIWCRFERLLLILARSLNKLDEAYKKAGRQRFKSLLKQPANRNLVPLFNEYAIYEYECQPQDITKTCSIFENIIATHQGDDSTMPSSRPAELCQTFVDYTEILMSQGRREEALNVLVCYALSMDIRQKSEVNSTKVLTAFKRLDDKLKSLLSIEENVDVMILDQYLLPDYVVNLVKVHTLLQYLTGQKAKALSQLDVWIKTFSGKGLRHKYLREQFYEIYLATAQLPATNYQISTSSLSEQLFRALAEFPRNLYFLQQCSVLATCLPWYKIRANVLQHNPTVTTITFLIAIIRQRYLQTINPTQTAGAQQQWLSLITAVSAENDRSHAERLARNRILDMFKMLTEGEGQQQRPNDSQSRRDHKYNILHRNALFWRFYLRCVSDQKTDFETSHRCLLRALDNCPWNKSLYLDGATYVPQEAAQIQDLLIEKELRICALPEELEILREDDDLT